MPTYNQQDAISIWDNIATDCTTGLNGQAGRDFCALECLANAPLYAKPDSQKAFLLWEAKNTPAIKIETITGFSTKHPWVHALFITEKVVRFPFNTWDSNPQNSLSWATIDQDLLTDTVTENFRLLPRWSTASRSCLALIPQDATALPKIAANKVDLGQRFKLEEKPGKPSPNVPEWKAKGFNRFVNIVSDAGKAASPTGCNPNELANTKYRLYSVKTGVDYVGSQAEGGFGKNRLEANCSMAMLRSEVIEAMPNTDPSFGVQTEVLTITAPTSMTDKNGKLVRDGFQVRNLSCMKPGAAYIPCQAIPYARNKFDREIQPADQCESWRNNFAISLGRAKARLFLNYGLIHTSANAQNFLLGFNGNTLAQFVARDVGDTSWHDDYLTRYFSESPTRVARFAYLAFQSEAQSAVKHVLHETSSGDYPPPHIVRLATNSVLTHDFGKVLIDNHNWTSALLYNFATGILDGFKAYIQEALNTGDLYPQQAGVLSDEQILAYGTEGKYPTPKPLLTEYKNQVNGLLKQDASALFAKAARVRERAIQAMNNNEETTFGSNEDKISTLLNAEEILLCAGIEKKLGIAPNTTSSFDITQRLDSLTAKGNWPKIVT
ncbi:hypothetical protein KO528_00705 [Saccharophagus degradans]|uniref:hypothetical protein n=1 Tax=Saccharophagus degradans TaxID=86304 RepID=UPI001C085BAB|nr:hypothetical protein [Saccharophagus degradans]MBU2983856.1 hypothetical protein [Saccharophagus degradans]